MDRLVLDRQMFKVLSSDTRLDLLKALQGRQKNLAELARETGADRAVVHRHLQQLADVGLAERLAGERKWVYYRLTRKARRLLEPKPGRVWLVISGAVAALLAAGAGLWTYLWWTRPIPPQDGVPPLPGPADGGAGATGLDPLIIVLIAFVLAGGFAAVYCILKVRRWAPPHSGSDASLADGGEAVGTPHGLIEQGGTSNPLKRGSSRTRWQ